MSGPIDVVALAAGGSSRMGSPKQLLCHRGRPLARHAAEVAVATDCGPVLIVLGPHAGDIEEELAGLPLTPLLNSNREAGLGGSIRAGVGAISRDESVEAVVLLLSDQPMVGPEVVAALIDRFHRDRPTIVASEYGGTACVPALFARDIFPGLLTLPDGEGAKRLILEVGASAARVPFAGGLVDVDTPGDYERLLASESDSRP